MGDERESSADNGIPFRNRDDGEPPVIDLPDKSINRRRLLRAIGFGLLFLTVLLPAIMLFVTGNWIFAGLWIFVWIYFLTRLNRRLSPTIVCDCPHCGAKMKIFLEPVIPALWKETNAVCLGCETAFRFRLVK